MAGSSLQTSPVNEDGFGGARYISAVDVFIPRTINYQYNTTPIQLLVDAVNALTERFGEDLVLVVGMLVHLVLRTCSC